MQVYAAPIDTPGLVKVNGRFDFDATIEAEEKYIEDLKTHVKENFNGPLAGEIVRTPMGDGYAQYMVAKVQGRTALIHIATGDAWSDPRFERTVTVKEVKEILASQRRLSAIFS